MDSVGRSSMKGADELHEQAGPVPSMKDFVTSLLIVAFHAAAICFVALLVYARFTQRSNTRYGGGEFGFAYFAWGVFVVSSIAFGLPSYRFLSQIGRLSRWALTLLSVTLGALGASAVTLYFKPTIIPAWVFYPQCWAILAIWAALIYCAACIAAVPKHARQAWM